MTTNKNYKKTVQRNNYLDKSAAVYTPQNISVISLEEEKEMNALYRSFYGRGDYKFGIFPSYWKDTWGKAPLLGIVFADNEFLAERLAYDRGILPTPFNCTFQPKIKNLGVNKSK